MAEPRVLAAVIGHPIAHSLSPRIFELLGRLVQARHKSTQLHYFAQDVSRVELGAMMEVLRSGLSIGIPFVGCNVTLPHKRAVISYLDELSPDALETGAVNMIEVARAPAECSWLIGHNTDVFGLMKTFQEHSIKVRGKAVVLFGAGGAARAVVSALGKAGAAEVFIWARKREQAQRLCRESKKRFPKLRFHSFANLKSTPQASLYVNATPLGMMGASEENPLLNNISPPEGPAWAFDLVYRPENTSFLRAARKSGLIPVGGLDMLVWQAIRTWEIWFGAIPQVKIVKGKLHADLRRQLLRERGKGRA